MKIFVSSVITGFEPFREAACASIKALGYDVIRAEDFPATAKSPQVACLSGLREADLVLLILGERYGYPQPSGRSATHEEYDEAKNRKPLLVFVQEKANMEPEQVAFRREVERWQGGSFWKGFVSPEDLQAKVTEAIHRHSLALERGRVDEEELLRRAQELVPRDARRNSAAIVVALSFGPKQQLLRPKQLEDPTLARRLHKEARFGQHAVFDELAEAAVGIKGDTLVLEQGERAILLDELGSMVFELPALSREDRGLGWLIAEDIDERIETALRFAHEVLRTIDGTERATHVAIVAALLDAAHNGWKTREEFRREPNSGTMGMADKRILVNLRPAARPREQLGHDPKTLAEDLVHLLRRAHSPNRR